MDTELSLYFNKDDLFHNNITDYKTKLIENTMIPKTRQEFIRATSSTMDFLSTPYIVVYIIVLMLYWLYYFKIIKL
jgi:hypothetical protein